MVALDTNVAVTSMLIIIFRTKRINLPKHPAFKLSVQTLATYSHSALSQLAGLPNTSQ